MPRAKVWQKKSSQQGIFLSPKMSPSKKRLLSPEFTSDSGYLENSPFLMKKAPKSNRHLSEHISLALNKIRKPSTAGEITELLNRDLEQGERPFFEEKRHRAVVAKQ